MHTNNQLHQHHHALHINCNQLCTMYHIHIDINITYLHLYINKQYSIKHIQYKCIIKHTQPVTPSCTLPKPYYPQYNLPGDSTLYSWDMIDTLTIAQDKTHDVCNNEPLCHVSLVHLLST